MAIFKGMQTVTDHVLAVVDRIYAGESLTDALRAEGIAPRPFFDAIHANADLEQMYARAQQARSEIHADEVVWIADNEPDPQRARNRMDARRWHASKMQPGKFGDKLQVDVNQTVDIRAAIEDGRKRAALPIRYQHEVIDAQAVDITALPSATSPDSQSDDVPASPAEEIDPFS